MAIPGTVRKESQSVLGQIMEGQNFKPSDLRHAAVTWGKEVGIGRLVVIDENSGTAYPGFREIELITEADRIVGVTSNDQKWSVTPEGYSFQYLVKGIIKLESSTSIAITDKIAVDPTDLTKVRAAQSGDVVIGSPYQAIPIAGLVDCDFDQTAIKKDTIV